MSNKSNKSTTPEPSIPPARRLHQVVLRLSVLVLMAGLLFLAVISIFGTGVFSFVG